MILSQRAFRKMSSEMQTLITDAGRDAQEYCLTFQLVEGVRARQRLIESLSLIHIYRSWRDTRGSCRASWRSAFQRT